MATPKMLAMDQALAEVEVLPPDPGRWAGHLADVARQMRTVIGRHREIVPCLMGFLSGGGRALCRHERIAGHLAGRRPADSRAADVLELLRSS